MQGFINKGKYWRVLTAWLMVLGLVMLTSGSLVQANGKSNPGVVPPDEEFNQKTYGEWSADWWQWVYSLPVDGHPLFDTADCRAGQTGKVWFLGGTYTLVEEDGVVRGEAYRDCTVPTGRALFFPIVNAECNEIVDASADEVFLRGCANFLADHVQVDSLEVTIDGKAVKDLDRYRAESPLFTIGPLRKKNILAADYPHDAKPGTKVPSVADGYYLMLAPLSSGEHEIHFQGEAIFTNDPDGFDFHLILDITYNLTVGRGGHDD